MENEISQEVLDELNKDELTEKDITQLERVEPVSRALTSMGTFWKKITTKLSDDSICYMCKKKLGKKEEFDIIEVPHKKVDKGLVAFVSICKKCNTESTTSL